MGTSHEEASAGTLQSSSDISGSCWGVLGRASVPNFLQETMRKVYIPNRSHSLTALSWKQLNAVLQCM
jgi:hypothetical protein